MAQKVNVIGVAAITIALAVMTVALHNSEPLPCNGPVQQLFTACVKTDLGSETLGSGSFKIEPPTR
jgi:hypothetical protein